MEIRTARTLDEIRDVAEFRDDETWEHARKFLRAAPADPFADHLRWMEKGGRPVACVQVFLHQYPIGCAEVGMCLPEYPFVPPELRGRGYFKALMADLFGWMRRNGYPLAYSHGRKGLYTGLGYAPALHHCMVLIRVADAAKLPVTLRAREATEEEVAANAAAFRQPFPLGRGLQCRDEGWPPDARCVRLVAARDGSGLSGFVVAGRFPIGRREDSTAYAGLGSPEAYKILTITDAWSADPVTAATLLKSAANEAQTLALEWVRINCRRTDPLARIAVLAGGQFRWWAAQERDYTEEGEDVDAFYLADLRPAIEQLLPELDERWKRFQGNAPPAMRLCMDDGRVRLWLRNGVVLLNGDAGAAPAVRLPRKAMTQAFLGYAAPAELSLLHEGCQIPEECAQAVDALFPAREPQLIHEGMAFAEPDEFGLVP